MDAKDLDIASLRVMANAMSDLEFTDEELAKVLPYVKRQMEAREVLNKLDFSGIEPQSLDPETYLKDKGI